MSDEVALETTDDRREVDSDVRGTADDGPVPSLDGDDLDAGRPAVRVQPEGAGEAPHPGGVARLDPIRTAALEWLLLPAESRVPDTQKALAAQLGVHENAIGEFKREYAFSREFDRRWRALHGGAPNVEQVVKALREKAEGGDVRAAEIYLRYTGAFEQDDEDDDYRQLTDAELRKRLALFV